MIKTINPYTGERINKYEFLRNDEIEDALDFAAGVYQRWQRSSFLDREKPCRELGRLLIERKDELAELITQEMGKPLSESLAELEKCSVLCDYYADTSEKALSPKKIRSGFNTSFVKYENTGAVFGIMPWNFPFWQVFRYAIPNLLAGNIVLLKHAPNTTGCGLEIQELFEEAGFPLGVFQTLLIDVPEVEQIIRHRVVQGVTFTGSARAGASVAALAGKYMKKSVLELGGNDAFIIMENCFWNGALQAGLESRLANSGQTCLAAKRFFVQEGQYERFVKDYKEGLKKVVGGDVMDKKTTLGVIAREDLADHLENQIKRCLELGGESVVESKREGNYFSPGLIKVLGDNPILKEEIFGPVGLVLTYTDEQDLIDQVNSSDFGLGATIWCKDQRFGIALASELKVGTVAINEIMKSDPRFPFGGTKASGYGRELSENGLMEFVNIKTVYGNR